MIGKFAFLLIALFVYQSEALKPPSFFKLCARTDPKLSECIIKHGQEALPSLLKGDRKYKIPELLPFVIPEINIATGGNLKINLKNAKISGLDGTVVKGANFDFKNKKISMDFKVPRMTIESDYEISGRILVLPISGKGPSSLILEDLDFTYFYDYDLIKKGKDEYMKPKKGNIKYSTKLMKLRFDNLFNGEKVLGAETNNFLNENWREVDKELGPGIAEALAEVINLIITNVCELVPFQELFPEKFSNSPPVAKTVDDLPEIPTVASLVGEEVVKKFDAGSEYLINVPDKPCPEGQSRDHKGRCRPAFG